jgi:hypothetical protein
LLVNTDPWSDIILVGNPWSLNQFFKNRLARSSIEVVFLYRIYFETFIYWSIITRIELYSILVVLLILGERSIIKSININSNGLDSKDNTSILLAFL